MYESIIEKVKHTHRHLRQQALATMFDEFDIRIMKLDQTGRMMKYSKMAESPYSFFRGSAYLFYADVSREWFPYHTAENRPTWVQGDLHLENFGAFKDENGDLVYDINDFDEGCLGSYLYDLLRMSASIALAGKELGLDEHERIEAIEAYAQAYYRQIRKFAEREENPSRLQFSEDNTDGSIRKLLRKLEKREPHKFMLSVTAGGQERQFVRSEELEEVEAGTRRTLLAAWEEYLGVLGRERELEPHFFRIKDMAVKKGSGTASIGLDRYYLLIEGGGAADAMDDVVLEVKEARVPVPAYFLPYREEFWREFGHQGRRVAATQQAMHHEADPFLGYLTFGGKQYYIRERSPYKKKLKLSDLEGKKDFLEALEIMGRITAKAHARADADVENGVLAYHSEDEIAEAMGEKSGVFARDLAMWAVSYARQTEADYQLFLDWVQKGAPAAGELPLPGER